ncbi:MAG: FtsQ-type POTRA domain-containing protein, partial [Chloroflexi bacterium]|nr:FtsQ-type POTRA domain-containing protein [Chloroflexota bacterium]
YRLPLLSVTEVRVQGLVHLSDARVQRLAEAKGANLLALEITTTERKLLVEPWIAGAQVRRRLPALVEITVEERTPGAVWVAANGRFLMATDGMILEEASDGTDLPVIFDANRSATQPGQTVAAAPVGLAFRLIQETPAAVGTRVTALEYRDPDGLTVQTENGWRAAFGDDTSFDQKLAVWRGVMNEVTRQGIKANFVDLRFGGRPYLR